MMEVRHLNEPIIILVIHGSDSAWGWHKITRVIVFDQLISSHMRFRAIQGAHILHQESDMIDLKYSKALQALGYFLMSNHIWPGGYVADVGSNNQLCVY